MVLKETGIEGFHVHQMRRTLACQRYARLSDGAVRREDERLNMKVGI